MVGKSQYQASAQDPLRDIGFRAITGTQVQRILGQDTNPFTKQKWSQRYRGMKIHDSRKKLPVYEQMSAFYAAFKKHQVIIVHGSTGTGKTTQIPQMVAYADLPHTQDKIIACAQTRRIAATSAAKRVADEMDVTLGKEVGYSVRFDSKHDPASTLLLFMTDGMLLHEAKRDPDLSKYSTVILDEVHERTLATDILIGFLRDVLGRRKDLKLVIMSATMDAQQITNYFSSPTNGHPSIAPSLLEVRGRAFNVSVEYDNYNGLPYEAAAIEKVIEIHGREPAGDILVFLTGEQEIEQTLRALRKRAHCLMEKDPDIYGPLLCLPLYANLPRYLQQLVWEDPTFDSPEREGGPRGRKVIMATNIAETSLTIDGIVYVVDSGYAKPRVYNPESECGQEFHTVQVVSKASAEQRKGRAGRTRDGKCYRLYTEWDYEQMAERDQPQMQTTGMGELVLTLANIGYSDPTRFPYVDQPDLRSIRQAKALLIHLGAINPQDGLTELGSQMVELPLDPQLSKMLIKSPNFGCSEEIVSIVAMLSAPHVWARPWEKRHLADEVKKEKFDDPQSDHLTLLNLYDAYVYETGSFSEKNRELWCKDNFVSFRALQEAQNIRKQLVKVMNKLGIPLVSISASSNDAEDMGWGWDRDIGDRERLRESIRKALVTGFFMQVAHSEALGDSREGKARNNRGAPNLDDGGGRQQEQGGRGKNLRGSYETIKNEPAVLHPSSALPLTADSEWVIFHQFVFTTQPFIRIVTSIKQGWLVEYASESYDAYADRETKFALQAINIRVEKGKQKAGAKRQQAEKKKEQAAKAEKKKEKAAKKKEKKKEKKEKKEKKKEKKKGKGK